MVGYKQPVKPTNPSPPSVESPVESKIDYENPLYPWHRVVAVVNTLLQAAGNYDSSCAYEFTYARGTISFAAKHIPLDPMNSKGVHIISSETHELVVCVRVKEIFTNFNGIVFEATVEYGKVQTVRVFQPSDWVDALESIVALADLTGKERLAPIDDNYLFPEYSDFAPNLGRHPLTGGQYTQWREGSHLIQMDLLKIGKYSDQRIKIELAYSNRQLVKSVHVSITPPMPMPFRLSVFTIGMTGTGFHVYTFRPGKWIFYVAQLADARPY